MCVGVQLVYIILILTESAMNCIYDIDSDQLKCNFCTNYFKCSLHFANLQRYALKACPNCLNAFSFSLLHPATYQVYRLLLLDTGLTLPAPLSPNPLLRQAEEEAIGRVSAYFEQKIMGLMGELAKIKQNMRAAIMKMEKEYADVLDATLLPSPERQAEMDDLLQRLREYQVGNMVAEKGRVQLGKERTKDLLKSGRKSPHQRLQDKENIHAGNCSNVSKLLKSKICGTSSRVVSSSKSTLGRSISKSVIKSIKMQSFEGDSDRTEVSRLLQTKSSFQSYMPREVVKQSNVCLKSEGSRNAVESVLELRNRTARTPQIIELIGGDASRTNFPCYLRTLHGHREAKTVRMIRCSLVDADMDHLLHFLSESPGVETLIVTNNRLTDLSVQALCTFKERHPQSRLSNVYLGNNFISSRATALIARREGCTQLAIHL